LIDPPIQRSLGIQVLGSAGIG
jgi:hypothetical protein